VVAEQPSPGQRALGTAAAVVPGALVHGSGLFAIGDERGAWRLLQLQGVAVAAILVGGGSLVATGASRKISGPAMPLLVSGGGLFVFSWLADVYGASGLAKVSGAPLQPPAIRASLGYGYVNTAQFDYGHFTVADADIFAGNFHFDPSAWIAADADNQRLRVGARYRLLGATADRSAADGSYFDVGTAVVYHRYGDDGFDSRVLEASAGGRLDLAHFSPNLRGGFLELSTGGGLDWTTFEVADDSDLVGLLLGTAAFGMRIGQPGQVDGEVRFAYDHRRDDFAAGLSPGRGTGSGYVGHFGGSGEVFFGSWGLRADAWFGAAHVYRLSLARRLGGSW
jgi:hypothetical protein